MNAVKTLALGVLVIGAAVQGAKAGPFSSSFTWTAWNANTGAVQASGVSDPFDLSSVNPPAQINPTPAAASRTQVYVPPTPQPVANTPAPAPIAVTPVQAPVTSNPAPVMASTPLPQAPPVQPVIETASFMSAQSAAPMFAPTPTPSSSTTPTTYDAYINLSGKGFADAANLTGSAPQAWYQSTQITGLFGGHAPTSAQQAAFDNLVVQRVESTFQLAGIHVNLTSDPNAQAAHTLSVVGNTTSSWGPLLGLTIIGGNGFDFIDQAAKSATSVDQLAWVVAHNVSHELMLAFGVGENYDKSGNYIDAETANLAMMLNPKATFSQSAAAALLAEGSLSSPTSTGGAYAQEVSPQPVPEPTTIALWSVAGIVGFVLHRRRRQLSAI